MAVLAIVAVWALCDIAASQRRASPRPVSPPSRAMTLFDQITRWFFGILVVVTAAAAVVAA